MDRDREGYRVVCEGHLVPKVEVCHTCKVNPFNNNCALYKEVKVDYIPISQMGWFDELYNLYGLEERKE